MANRRDGLPYWPRPLRLVLRPYRHPLKHLKEFAPLAFGHPELEGIIPEAERAIQKLQSSLNN
jgi:hypothetical protein